MNSYLFLLGQNHDLSIAELLAIYPQMEWEVKNNYFGKGKFKDDNCLELACRLGGTTKIARQVATFSDKDLINILVSLIKNEGHKNFSITTLGNMPSVSEQVKERLVTDGFSARFVSASKESLSPLIVDKQHVTELIIDEEEQTIYKTVWVHPYKQWIERDRRKPYIDAKSGMLPPKLARMMVNLALGDRKADQLTMLDPFCGTGTLLMEAKLMGLNVIGSDQSSRVIEGAGRNVDWLPESHYCTSGAKSALIVADATHVSEKIDQKIDLIVTEPYLGPAYFEPGKIKNIVKGLEKLYLGALKDWQKILTPGAKVVMVFPQFLWGNRVISTSDLIDRQANLSYNLLVEDLVFTRPNARIIRQIVILERK